MYLSFEITATPVVAHQTYAAAPAYAVAPALKTYATARKNQIISNYQSKKWSEQTNHLNIKIYPNFLIFNVHFHLAVLHAPIAKVAYSPASEVSHVYSSIAAPQYAANQYVYGAQAGYAHAAPFTVHAPAIGSSQQSTIRSLGGTISTSHAFADTAFSSVRKADTRISNNYTPVLATKTIAYQQPAILEQKHIPATVVSHVAFDGIGAHYAW